MTLGFLGLFFELTTPGFGFAGAMGLTALALFFAGHLLVHLAGVEEIALFILGVLLLALEVFVIPGFGITGILGLTAIAASLILSLVGLDLDRVALSPVGIREALLRVIISFVVTAVGAALMLKYLPRTSVGRRLVLEASLPSGSSTREVTAELAKVGDDGVALTDLKPYGRARIHGNRLDVVSTGRLIDKGEEISVVRVSGDRVEVRPVAGPDAKKGEQ
jgi:membrane-bound serine protease (ClpP class)